MAEIKCVRVTNKRIGSKKISRCWRVTYDTGNVREYMDQKLPYKVERWIEEQEAVGNSCILKEEVVMLVGYKFKNIEEELK